jgi:hypothetical protein
MRDTPYRPAPPTKNQGEKKTRRNKDHKNESKMSHTPDKSAHNLGQELEFTAEGLGIRSDRGFRV